MSPRHPTLLVSVAIYVVAVRQVVWGYGSGIPVLDAGMGWHALALLTVAVGIGAGFRIAWLDFVRLSAAPKWRRALGWVGIVIGAVMTLAWLLVALVTAAGLPMPMPGARLPPLD